MCRNLLSLVEPKFRLTEIGLTPVALRILNTIMPVARVFTAMDAAKPVINTVSGQSLEDPLLLTILPPKAAASQVAGGNKLKSDYQMKID